MKWIRIIALVLAFWVFIDWAKDTKFVKELFPEWDFGYRWEEGGQIKVEYKWKKELSYDKTRSAVEGEVLAEQRNHIKT